MNGGRVSSATRERVLAAVAELSYRPNQAAKSLARGSSGVVGVVLHQLVTSLRCDTYAAGLYEGIAHVLSTRSTAGIMQWFGHQTRQELVDVIAGSCFVDGIIATTSQADDPLIERLIESEIPTVVVGNQHLDQRVSYVAIDDVTAARVATAHLVARGATRIGHITGDLRTRAARDRLDGYHQALDAARVTERLVAESDFGVESGSAAARQLLDRGVDAIFAASDHIAEGVYATCAKRGERIPDDVLVIGFDDVEQAAAMDPPLSTMRQSPPGLGATAAELLLAILGDPERRPRQALVAAPLVERDSTRRC